MIAIASSPELATRAATRARSSVAAAKRLSDACLSPNRERERRLQRGAGEIQQRVGLAPETRTQHAVGFTGFATVCAEGPEENVHARQQGSRRGLLVRRLRERVDRSLSVLPPGAAATRSRGRNTCTVDRAHDSS